MESLTKKEAEALQDLLYEAGVKDEAKAGLYQTISYKVDEWLMDYGYSSEAECACGVGCECDD
jgi:hypothetical protein